MIKGGLVPGVNKRRLGDGESVGHARAPVKRQLRKIRSGQRVYLTSPDDRFAYGLQCVAVLRPVWDNDLMVFCLCIIARRLRSFALAIAACLLSTAALAQGGPPLLTDDPGTPGNQNWEINIGITDSGTHGRHTLETPILDLNYGAGDRVQLKFEVPWLVETGKGPTYSEAGSSLTGVKYRFFDQEKMHLDVATYPQLRLSSPGPGRIDEDNIEFLLPLEIVRTQGKVQLNWEAGYNFRQHGLDEWLFGFAVAYNGPGKWQWLAELHSVALRDFSDREFVFQAGFRRELSPHYSILFAAGRGLPASSDRQPDITGYVGLQLRLGKHVQDTP